MNYLMGNGSGNSSGRVTWHLVPVPWHWVRVGFLGGFWVIKKGMGTQKPPHNVHYHSLHTLESFRAKFRIQYHP